MNTPTENVLAKLPEARRSGDGWAARCPAHDDRQASLSINTGDDGRVLIHDHAGCPPEAIVAALGLKLADLMPIDGHATTNGHESNGKPKGAKKTWPTAEATIAALEAKRGPAANRWPYHNADSEIVGWVLRWNEDDGKKTFLPVSLFPDGWQAKGMAEPRPLYELRTLAAAEVGYVCEGEKAADAARSIGLPATTSAHGAKSPTKTDWTPLAGKSVVILPDSDQAGRDYAETVAGILAKLEPPAIVKIVALPGLPEGGDIVEWIDQLHGDAAEPDSMRAEIEALVEAAEPWQPSAKAKRKTPRAKPAIVAPGDATKIPPIRFDAGRTDMTSGRKFVALSGDDFRYIPEWDKYLVWNGQQFVLDNGPMMEAKAKKVSELLFHEAAAASAIADRNTLDQILSFCRYSSGSRGIANMIGMTRSEPGVSVSLEKLNADPWLLNVANGTLNLSTNELRPHRRADLLTKLCPTVYDPAAACPLWLSVLKRISGGRKSIEGFLQRLAGYSLTGVVRDHVLAFLFGTGANGKSTFLNTFMAVLGADYATKLAAEVLMQRDGATHPTGLTDLYGTRLAVVIETEEGKRITESMAKELSGGDSIRARRMRENYWEFQPTHKLWFATNHKPLIRGTDHAIWRRIRLVPFDATIPDSEQITDLGEQLKAEASGILNWMLAGCAAWQAAGLGEPDEVKQATAGYRVDMDTLGTFLKESCTIGQHFTCRASSMYSAYVEWTKATGEYAMSGRRFGMAMTERGFERFTSNGVIYRGIGLLSAEGTEGSE